MNTYELISFIANIVVAVTGASAVITVIIAYRQYKYRGAWQEKEKAAELSRFYQQHILDEIYYVEYIFENAGVLEDIARLREFKEFTSNELRKKAGKDNFENFILNKIADQSNEHVFIDAAFLFRKKMIIEDSTSRASVLIQFEKDLSALLNSMEYFSMCFTTGVADESVVYQSLHQSYIKCVEILSWYIAFQNTSPKNKYYTNLTDLYKLWSERDKYNEELEGSIISSQKKIKK